jgi:hypothetical protein
MIHIHFNLFFRADGKKMLTENHSGKKIFSKFKLLNVIIFNADAK